MSAIEAETALRTALSFINDVRYAVDARNESERGKEMFRYHLPAHFRSLSLAAEQITRAEKIDPHATLTVEKGEEHGEDATLPIISLKMMALIWEGYLHTVSDAPKKAIRIYEQATRLKPDSALAWYLLGEEHANQLNRHDAVHALQKAVELKPTDIDHRKALERAKAISTGQIVLKNTAKAINTTFWITVILQFLLFAGCAFVFVYGLTLLGTSPGEGFIFMIGGFLIWVTLSLFLTGIGKILEWFR